MHDDLHQVAEADEANNVWGHQFIWTGAPLNEGTVYGRTPPPHAEAGWPDIIDGSSLWFNCDGLKFATNGYWHAAVVWALDDGDNYDLRLHAESTGAENGYAVNQGYSSQAAGYLDGNWGLFGTADVLPYIILLVILLFKPHGLFGIHEIERV